MKYREMGRTGVRVSALGFGCMRFPTLSRRPSFYGKVDEREARHLLQSAFDKGVNYFDTAYNYHGGRSESILGRFLGTVRRDRILVATKLPGWRVKKPSDFARIFRLQLRRLDTDYIDFYLLHGLNGASFEHLRQQGVLDFIEGLKKDGRVRFLGFSFHDSGAAFRPIVDAFDWDFCQIQYNIVDARMQAGRSGLLYAARRGLGVVIMEPLHGGDLVECIPDPIRRMWERGAVRSSPAGTCLAWIWDHPGVSLILSGMSSREQLDENIAVASRSRPGMLTPEERRLTCRIRAAYSRMPIIRCTRCGYCMPCPAGVNIPQNFHACNMSVLFPGSGTARMEYNVWMRPEQRASACISCGKCEPRCPQGLGIRDLLRDVEAEFGNRRT